MRLLFWSFSDGVMALDDLGHGQSTNQPTDQPTNRNGIVTAWRIGSEMKREQEAGKSPIGTSMILTAAPRMFTYKYTPAYIHLIVIRQYFIYFLEYFSCLFTQSQQIDRSIPKSCAGQPGIASSVDVRREVFLDSTCTRKGLLQSQHAERIRNMDWLAFVAGLPDKSRSMS